MGLDQYLYVEQVLSRSVIGGLELRKAGDEDGFEYYSAAPWKKDAEGKREAAVAKAIFAATGIAPSGDRDHILVAEIVDSAAPSEPAASPQWVGYQRALEVTEDQRGEADVVIVGKASDTVAVQAKAPTMLKVRTCVAYWRKANQIHNWFVQRVQGGVDECQYSEPFDRETLRELVDLCQKVIDGSKMIDGATENGYSFDDKGNRVSNMENAKVVEDAGLALKFVYHSSW